MNIQQKKYLIGRIEQIGQSKIVFREKKETVLLKLIILFGKIRKNMWGTICRKIEKNDFLTSYNDHADIKLEPEDYLTNFSEVKAIQKANSSFNAEVFKADQVLITKVENDIKEITDKVMFGTNEEAYQMLNDFIAKEYK